jgi:methyl-accepting chemotaxis protein
MSHTQPTSTSTNFQLIFDSALKTYRKRTKNDLLKHPLAGRLEACNSASSIRTVLQELVQELNDSQRSNGKWLDPTVNVLLAFSETLGEPVSSVLPPAKVIFTAFGVLLSTAKDVRADQDNLFEMFERIEAFFWRLDIYTKVAPNEGMLDKIAAIMAEVLNILAIATKEIKQGRLKKYVKKLMKKLIGNNDIEDALKRLDRLTQEEARMASAQLIETADKIANNVLDVDHRVAGVDDRVAGVGDQVAGVDGRVAGVDERVTSVDERVAGVDEHVAGVDDRVAGVDDRVKDVDDKLVAVIDDGKEAREVIHQAADGVDRIERSQLRQDLRRWLSPPDPSTNHKIACRAHHKGTATWFFEGRTYNEWKSTGSDSLLWIHGKRASLSHSAA